VTGTLIAEKQRQTIQKLLRLADDRAAFPGEAANARAKAERLMRNAGLTLADVWGTTTPPASAPPQQDAAEAARVRKKQQAAAARKKKRQAEAAAREQAEAASREQEQQAAAPWGMCTNCGYWPALGAGGLCANCGYDAWEKQQQAEAAAHRQQAEAAAWAQAQQTVAAAVDAAARRRQAEAAREKQQQAAASAPPPPPPSSPPPPGSQTPQQQRKPASRGGTLIVLTVIAFLATLAVVSSLARSSPAPSAPPATATLARAAAATPQPTRTPGPQVARDGQTLGMQPQDVQGVFGSAWGDQAAAEWASEHDAASPAGRTSPQPASVPIGSTGWLRTDAFGAATAEGAMTLLRGGSPTPRPSPLAAGTRVRLLNAYTTSAGVTGWVQELDGPSQGEQDWVDWNALSWN
jgi:hypothetical protein